LHAVASCSPIFSRCLESRLSSLLNGMGISASSLSSSAQEELNQLTSIAQLLQLKNVDPITSVQHASLTCETLGPMRIGG
jgi:hypothetical protein